MLVRSLIQKVKLNKMYIITLKDFVYSLYIVVRKKAEVLCININRTAVVGTPLPFKTSTIKNKTNEDTAKSKQKEKSSTGDTPIPMRSKLKTL
jgi:hypothetical protein